MINFTVPVNPLLLLLLLLLYY